MKKTWAKYSDKKVSGELKEELKEVAIHWFKRVRDTLTDNEYVMGRLKEVVRNFSESIMVDINVIIGPDDDEFVTGIHTGTHNAPFLFPLQQDSITIKINIPYLLENIFVFDNFKHLLSNFMIVIEHGKVHGAQLRKMGTKKFIGTHELKKSVKSHQKYIGTPLEKPAWGRTIAMAFYYDNNKDVNTAIEKLKTLDISRDFTPLQTINNILKREVKSGNKQIKDVIKYAYLTLVKIRDKNKDIEEIKPEDLARE